MRNCESPFPKITLNDVHSTFQRSTYMELLCPAIRKTNSAMAFFSLPAFSSLSSEDLLKGKKNNLKLDAFHCSEIIGGMIDIKNMLIYKGRTLIFESEFKNFSTLHLRADVSDFPSTAFPWRIHYGNQVFTCNNGRIPDSPFQFYGG